MLEPANMEPESDQNIENFLNQNKRKLERLSFVKIKSNSSIDKIKSSEIKNIDCFSF